MTAARCACPLVALALLAFLVPTAPLQAQGFIVVETTQVIITPRPEPMPRPIPRPPRHTHFPLEVRNQHVNTTIRDTVANTRVEQIFHNPNNQQMEGTYMLPLPETAAIQKFSMWMDGKEVHGELLDANKARQTYEEIVRRTRDPGLLEYVGQRLYRARVFPIPANGDVRIAVEYGETLTVDNGLGTYRYPLNTEKYSAKPIEDVAITVEITSQVPLKSVFCPSHTATISRPSDTRARVGFEARGVLPDRDFVVHYLMSDKEFGLSLLSFRPPAEEGYFLARISPPLQADADKILPKDVCLVLDTSGSMAGDKIIQAKKALNFCISSLRRDDRFNLITFATDVRPFRDSLVSATEENVAAARAEVEKLVAAGGTAIDESLQAALKVDAPRSGNRPYMIVFITDGEPTVGERNPDRILANVKAAPNQDRSRIFVFGVGHDLNTRLLDRLADDNRGAREYVTEKEDIEVKVSALFKKLSDPVLTDIEIKFADAETFDVYPKTWPDLFHGSELVVVGRYRRPGHHGMTMSGKRGNDNMTWRFDANFGESTRSESDFIPRIWATRKIGYLMDEIRLHGETKELKDEIVSLARRHAIVTPYTSYLVIEDTPEQAMALSGPQQLGAVLRRSLSESEAAGRQAGAGLEGRQGGFGGFASRDGNERFYRGEKAIDQSREAYRLRGDSPLAGEPMPAEDALRYNYSPALRPRTQPGKPADHDAEYPIKLVGDKTFYLADGRWIDSQYDGKAETRKIEAFSDAYFDLLKSTPKLGKYLAIGERVIVVLNSTAYEIQ